MTHLMFLIFSLLPTPPSAFGQGLLDQLHGKCVEKFLEEGNSKAKPICACIRQEYEKKDLKNEDLALMVASYNDEEEAESTLQSETNEDLVQFDYQAVEDCEEKVRKSASKK